MASGKQKAQQNLDAFLAWSASQSHDDYLQIVFRGQLNRGEVAKAIGCGKSALNQNPALKDALASLENQLREQSVLPPLANKTTDNPKEYDNTNRRRQLDSRRVSTLEAENIELKAKVKELEGKLERFGELSESLFEMGFMPR